MDMRENNRNYRNGGRDIFFLTIKEKEGRMNERDYKCRL